MEPRHSFVEKFNPIIWLFIIVQLFFIICIIVFLPLLFEKSEIAWDIPNEWPQVLIDDLSAFDSDIDDSDKAAVQSYLLDRIIQDYNSYDFSDRATIRPDTFKIVDFDQEGGGYRFVSFEVDIPKIKRSYQIYYIYSHPMGETPDLSVSVLCADTADSCQGAEEISYRARIAARYLEYANFDGFVAYVDPEDEEMKHIRVMSKKHEYTDEESERYVRETKEFIESLGISPELFEYTVEPAPLGESDEPVYAY